mgnify:CR=1 FL=1
MNCIIIDDDNISRILIEKYIQKTVSLNLLASFQNAIDALSYENYNQVDLMFIDIEMPEMTGLEFLKTFKAKPLVIIISAKTQYAIDALDLDAIDYLLKPIEYARFLKAVNKAKDIFKNKTEIKENCVFIKDINSSLVRLYFEEILWIEALENYIIIFTEKDKYTVHFTMKSIETKFPDSTFMRIHRSYIVNLQRIVAIDDSNVYVDYLGKRKPIPLAKGMRENLMNKIKIITK